ncbi:LysM peptidoglycan-binding domain-containing protein [Lachnospiraceae bacterium NSJ-143]|nr:LysM peptidoglycan-binding domain-containing protein [Lachnospiraceae bacterium NSJ-143]
MYSVYIGDILLPVTPEKITWTYKGQNDTVNLINMEEINRVRVPGLLEYSFSAVIPGTKVPYARYVSSFKEPFTYINEFETILKECKPVMFNIIREKLPYGRSGFTTKKLVTIESLIVNESVQNGLDVMLSIRLKEFKEQKSVKMAGFNNGSQNKSVRNSTKEVSKSYTVKKGDNLWSICKSMLNDGSKFSEVARINGITNPSRIYPGQVIRFE